jgi:hypothetical protein
MLKLKLSIHALTKLNLFPGKQVFSILWQKYHSKRENQKRNKVIASAMVRLSEVSVTQKRFFAVLPICFQASSVSAPRPPAFLNRKAATRASPPFPGKAKPHPGLITNKSAYLFAIPARASLGRMTNAQERPG